MEALDVELCSDMATSRSDAIGKWIKSTLVDYVAINWQDNEKRLIQKIWLSLNHDCKRCIFLWNLVKITGEYVLKWICEKGAKPRGFWLITTYAVRFWHLYKSGFNKVPPWALHTKRCHQIQWSEFNLSKAEIYLISQTHVARIWVYCQVGGRNANVHATKCMCLTKQLIKTALLIMVGKGKRLTNL